MASAGNKPPVISRVMLFMPVCPDALHNDIGKVCHAHF
jgi:hypothetical protein